MVEHDLRAGFNVLAESGFSDFDGRQVSLCFPHHFAFKMAILNVVIQIEGIA